MTATEVTKAAVPRRLPFDDALVRKVLGHFCTGVAVVTANHAGQRPVGFTCQSVAGLFLNEIRLNHPSAGRRQQTV